MTPLPAFFPSSFGLAAGVLAESLTHDTGRAASIAVGVAATVATARWVWKAILRQMRAEIVSVNQASIDALGVKIDALADRNDSQHAENGNRLEHIEGRVAKVEAISTTHADRLDRGSERMDTIISTLDALQGAVSALRTNPPRSLPLDPPTEAS